MNKLTLTEQVNMLAKKYNIPIVSVKNIMNAYLRECRWFLVNGSEIEFNGLATIKPAKSRVYTKTTLANISKRVADNSGVAYNTVYSILNEYIETLKAEILKGNTAEIRGLVTFKPVVKEDGSLALHSCISATLKEYVGTIRVHTHKMFKYQLKTTVVT